MTTASHPRPVEVARAVFDALNRRDLDTAARCWAPDVEHDIIPVGAYRGRAAVRGFFDELLAAAPDLAFTVDHLVGDAEHAVVQWHVRATFTGTPFLGIRATGGVIDLPGIDVMHVTDGTVRRVSVYYDGMAFARQVGMLPGAGTGVERALITAVNARTDLRKRIATLRPPGTGPTPGS